MGLRAPFENPRPSSRRNAHDRRLAGLTFGVRDALDGGEGRVDLIQLQEDQIPVPRHGVDQGPRANLASGARFGKRSHFHVSNDTGGQIIAVHLPGRQRIPFDSTAPAAGDATDQKCTQDQAPFMLAIYMLVGVGIARQSFWRGSSAKGCCPPARPRQLMNTA